MTKKPAHHYAPEKNVFRSPSKGRMALRGVIDEITGFIDENSGDRFQLIVGTDSSAANRQADFVTAIIVYRVGRGGRYFWKKSNGGKIYHTLRDRIYQEVALSLEIAQEIIKKLGGLLKENPQHNFEIHIDVGQNGPTRQMIKEVIGMVRGNGFQAKIKPESYAASCVADKYV